MHQILPHKEYRDPTHWEYVTLVSLRNAINTVRIQREQAIEFELDFSKHKGGLQEAIELDITEGIYNVGKDMYGKDKLREFFQMIYEVVMGQKSGPRLPVFVMLYGIDNTIDLLNEIIEKNKYMFDELKEKNIKNENVL